MRRSRRWRAACVASAVAVVTLGGAGATRADASPAAPCSGGRLAGAIEFKGAGVGNRYARLVVTNQGEACTLEGHPGLQLVGADGRLLGTQVSPRGNEPSEVSLPHLASAASELHWIVGPCSTQGDDGTPEARPASITVTPPGDTTGIAVPWTFGYVCGEIDGPAKIDASPFVAL